MPIQKLPRPQAMIVPVETFDPEPFELLREIKVVVQPDDDSWVAIYFDANINASGDTPQDAVANLKDMILGLFERLQREPKQRLGKEPSRQLAILNSLIRRKKKHAAHQQRTRQEDRQKIGGGDRHKHKGSRHRPHLP
jgi:predicted RNase H-like HicB family nuclease